MAIEDNDMDAFIRDTLNSYQRVREKNFVPVQQTILSRASTTIAGEPLALSPTVTITGGGIFGGGGASGGAFYSTYVDDAGDTYLVGGQVSGGTGNFTEPDIKIIDHSTGVLHTAGTNMILGVTGTGYAVDGVLLAGFTATASSIAYVAIPANTVPTATSLSGKRCYINLGVFTETGFQPSLAGNIGVSFCPSTYTVIRF
jgi:hypothetical protein